MSEYHPRRAPRIETLTVRGLDHRVTRWGPGTSEPVILLHGFLDCGATWQFLADALPDTWDLAAPDWRGFGGSAWAPGGYWFADYLADLDALLDALVPSAPARLVAHSMGGNIASLYAGVRPARLAWLINLEGVGLPATHPDDAPARYRRWLEELRAPPRASTFDSVEALAARLLRRSPRLGAERARFVARAWTQPAANGRVALAADPKHRWVNPVLYRREETEACWREVRVPTLLVLGAESDLAVRAGDAGWSAYYRGLLPHLETASLADTGHMMHHEDPAGVAALVVGFAERHRRGFTIAP